MALPIAGPGPRNGHVYLQDYAKKKWDCVPIAVPSKGREEQLCEQTLTMLKHHGYDMSLVHVFVDGERQREDGSAEYDRYWKKLRAEGFGMVGLHPWRQRLTRTVRAHFSVLPRRSRGGPDHRYGTVDRGKEENWKRRRGTS